MIKNLPKQLTQEQLLEELDRSGFAGQFDFCYKPIQSFRTRSGVGFAFVNLVSPTVVEKFVEAWHLRRRFGIKPGEPPLTVSPATRQGHELNAAHARSGRMRRIRNANFRPFMASTFKQDSSGEERPAGESDLKALAHDVECAEAMSMWGSRRTAKWERWADSTGTGSSETYNSEPRDSDVDEQDSDLEEGSPIMLWPDTASEDEGFEGYEGYCVYTGTPPVEEQGSVNLEDPESMIVVDPPRPDYLPWEARRFSPNFCGATRFQECASPEDDEGTKGMESPCRAESDDGNEAGTSSLGSEEVASEVADDAPASVVINGQSWPSVGSVGHPRKCGAACKYARKSRGCKDGANCDHCHLCKRFIERRPRTRK